MQKGYSDNIPSGYTVSNLRAVRHLYIIVVFIVSSVFAACSPGLAYLSWTLVGECRGKLARGILTLGCRTPSRW